jgi:hypothetical protein
MNERMGTKAWVAVLVSLSVASCSSASSGAGTTQATPENSAFAALSTIGLRLPRIQPGQSCPSSKLSQTPFGVGFGSGPVYATNIESVRSDPAHPWKVAWIADPSYRGPIRIRGGQIDGSGELLLGGGQHVGSPVKKVEGTELYRQMFLETDLTSTTPSRWRVWPSFTYIATPGCYAWQVDGFGFTEFITIKTLELPILAQGAGCPVSPQQVAHDLSGEFGSGPAIGTGPVYALMGEMQAGTLSYSQSQSDGWAHSNVLWIAKPNVVGRVLVRGHQIDGPVDGPNWIGFGMGEPPEFALQWEIASQTGWSSLPSLIRIRAPGCYAYQVDSQQGSEVIVFQAVAGP